MDPLASRPGARPACLLVLGALLLALLPGPRPVQAKGADPAEVRAALAQFGRRATAKEPAERIEAVRDLGACVHEQVAARLLKFVRREDDPAVLGAAYEALGRQAADAAKVVAALARRLHQDVEDYRKRMAKGDAGFRIDPRTGDADLDGPEGRARLLACEQRGRMLLALLGALEALGWEAGDAAADLAPLLQDPADALVVAVLRRIEASRARAALPAILDLFRMYPTPSSWETGAVVDPGGTDASARATWMVRFGHPDKQRARPEVVEALQRTVQALTGEVHDSPEQLAAWLAGAKGQRSRKG